MIRGLHPLLIGLIMACQGVGSSSEAPSPRREQTSDERKTRLAAAAERRARKNARRLQHWTGEKV